ncbi:TIGR00730 family Rossman fold protein [bacterium]|nr:TIGR00730 family Rossman fold protein [bacterium]
MKKRICVFASSSNKIDEVYFSEAKEIGNLIVKNGFDFVYGAGSVGTMYASALTAKEQGAKIYGVIPKRLTGIGVDWEDCDEYIVTDCMASRKKKMRELADAFVALPGGFGTLEEILEVITLKQLGYHSKPIVFLNTNDFYSNLFAQFNVFYEMNFARKESENLYYIAKNPKDAIEYIVNYKTPELQTEPFSKWAK